MTIHFAPWSTVTRLSLPDLVLAELEARRRILIFTPRPHHRVILDDLLAVVPAGATVYRTNGRERIQIGRATVSFAADPLAPASRTFDTLITTNTSWSVVAALTPCLAQSREPRRLVLLP